MTYLYEDILASHTALGPCTEVWTIVVVKKVLCNTCTLSFPVAPDTHGGVMNMVTTNGYVDSSVKLNTGNLGAAKLLHVVDVMNVVVLDS